MAECAVIWIDWIDRMDRWIHMELWIAWISK